VQEIETALEELYRRRYHAFRRAVASLVGGYDAAHDVVQDGFAAAYAKRRRYRGEGSLEGWVWRIVLRRAQAVRRRGLALGGAWLDPRLVAPEREPELAAAVRALPPRRRLIVFLRYYADLSYSEIAEATGIDRGTVSATLNQAHRQLQHLLREEART
jgi:DNA-directed RNA polymerase specialized sigma24 family protein